MAPVTKNRLAQEFPLNRHLKYLPSGSRFVYHLVSGQLSGGTDRHPDRSAPHGSNGFLRHLGARRRNSGTGREQFGDPLCHDIPCGNHGAHGVHGVRGDQLDATRVEISDKSAHSRCCALVVRGHGYEATSLDAMAKALEITKQSILYWFPSKDDATRGGHRPECTGPVRGPGVGVGRGGTGVGPG